MLLGTALLLAGLSASAQTLSSVTLGWDASSGITGYRLYQGGTSQNYTNTLNLGNVTTATVPGLLPGATYYFAVSAVDTNGVESALSSAISYMVPSGTVTPPSIVLSTPASGTSFTAPATVNLAATVVPNGHTVSKVQFFNGATLLAEDTAAPYAFTWSNVSTGSYSLSAKLVYDASSTLASATANITVSAPLPGTNTTTLPAPWQTVDLGKTGLAGNASVTNSRYSVTGAGNLSGTADNFRFLYQTLSGNGEIRAQVSSVQNTSTNARSGIMIRETLAPGSKYAFMGISPDGTFRAQRRTVTSGSTASGTSGKGILPNTWLRLVRSGNAFYSYKSTNGVSWTRINTRTNVMASNIYVGLAVASGSTNVLSTSTFTNVIVVP